MAGNSTPIYSKVADWQWAGAITAANTTKDLTTGTSYLVFTADATNGGYVKKIRVRHVGANASATVMRVFINNGSATNVATNNILFDEIGIAANASVSETGASTNYEIPINEALPPGYCIYVTIGTAITGGLAATAVAGKY
jgi:hypothetical protein